MVGLLRPWQQEKSNEASKIRKPTIQSFKETSQPPKIRTSRSRSKRKFKHEYFPVKTEQITRAPAYASGLKEKISDKINLINSADTIERANVDVEEKQLKFEFQHQIQVVHNRCVKINRENIENFFKISVLSSNANRNDAADEPMSESFSSSSRENVPLTQEFTHEKIKLIYDTKSDVKNTNFRNLLKLRFETKRFQTWNFKYICLIFPFECLCMLRELVFEKGNIVELHRRAV